MADTVNVQTVYAGRRVITHLTNESDGGGESGVTKIDISTLVLSTTETPTYSTIDLIEYSVGGFNYVVLEWAHDTNDEIAVLQGQGVIDWYAMGGKTDPQSTGGTGDIVLTTDGAVDGDSYDITIHLRPKP